MRKKTLLAVALLAVLAGPIVLHAQEGGTPAPANTEGSGSGGDTAKPNDAKGDGNKDGGGGGGGGMFGGQQMMLFGLLALLVLMFVLSGRSRKKEQKKRQDMLAALKKGDRVTTIGGVIGSVIEVKDDEVTIKVDENANVKMRFQRWAIQGIGETGKTEPEKDDKK